MATVTSAGVGGYWPSITLEGITKGLPLSSEKEKKKHDQTHVLLPDLKYFIFQILV